MLIAMNGLQCDTDGKTTVEITKHAAMYTTTAMTRADLAEGLQEGGGGLEEGGGGGGPFPPPLSKRPASDISSKRAGGPLPPLWP